MKIYFKNLIKVTLLILFCTTFFSSCAILFAEAGLTCPSQDEKTTYSNTGGDSTTGIQLTKNQSTKQANDEAETKAFLSYSVGGGAMWPISEAFSASTGVLLTGKGVKFENSTFNSEEKTNLTYIDLPLKAHYNIGETGFNINAGFQPSFLVGAKTELTFNGTSTETKGTDGYNSFDVSIGAGAGYRFDSGIALNLGYDHGLSNVLKTQDFGGFERRNRSLKLSVQYFFN